MRRFEKERLQRRSNLREHLPRPCSTSDAPVKLIFALLYIWGAILVWSKQDEIALAAETTALLSPIASLVMQHIFAVYLLVGGVFLSILILFPLGKKAAQDQLRSIGLVNHTDMVPALKRKYKDKQNPRISVWEFSSQGIPLKTWEDKQAVANGYIRFNPTNSCILPRIEKKELQPLDEAETKLFLDAVKGHPLELLYTITLFTGLREGEALGLTWDRVDFMRGTILISKQLQKEKKAGGQFRLVSLKNDKPRRIQPAPWVMQLLRDRKLQQYEHKEKAGAAWSNPLNLVFTNELGGNLIPQTVVRHFKEIVTAISRPDARFHDLRHSYVVASLRSGDDIKTVQGKLGHATAAFTLDVYGHVTNQMQEASAVRMEAYIKGILEL